MNLAEWKEKRKQKEEWKGFWPPEVCDQAAVCPVHSTDLEVDVEVIERERLEFFETFHRCSFDNCEWGQCTGHEESIWKRPPVK